MKTTPKARRTPDASNEFLTDDFLIQVDPTKTISPRTISPPTQGAVEYTVVSPADSLATQPASMSNNNAATSRRWLLRILRAVDAMMTVSQPRVLPDQTTAPV